MTLTYENIEAGRSTQGGWSRAQVELLGATWPLEKGWKRNIIGMEVTDDKYHEFLALKDRHLAQEGKPMKHPTDPIFKKRARALVKSSSGSNTFTCAESQCTYPKCMCSIQT